MGLKELLAQLEEKEVQELWDFKVKKVRNSRMAFTGCAGSSEMAVSGIILLNIPVFYFSILWLVYQRSLMNLHQETWKFCFSLLDYFARRFPDFLFLQVTEVI